MTEEHDHERAVRFIWFLFRTWPIATTIAYLLSVALWVAVVWIVWIVWRLFT